MAGDKSLNQAVKLLLLLCLLCRLPAVAAETRHAFDVGVEYQVDERQLSPLDAYGRIAQVAEIAYIQRNWDQWLNKPQFCVDEVAIARSKGLKIYTALDLLSYDNPRAEIVFPSGMKGSFKDPPVRKAYLDLVRKVVRDCRPDYFVLMVEVDMYCEKNPLDYAAFKSLLPEAMAIVRQESPATKAGVSITFRDYNGHGGIDAEDLAHFKSRVGDFDQWTDLLMVSVYPFFLLQPENMPSDFVETIAKGSSKPLFISETGWVSDDFDIKLPHGAVFKFKSDLQTQADYLKNLFASCNYANNHGRKVVAVNCVSLTDPSAFSARLYRMIKPEFSWFTSLAVCEKSGKPKPAYDFLKACHAARAAVK